MSDDDRLDLVEINGQFVRLLERRLASVAPEWRPRYRRALAFARARSELAAARAVLDSQPDALAPAVRRAWRHDPRMKWMLWYLAVTWPRALGGAATTEMIREKLRRKW